MTKWISVVLGLVALVAGTVLTTLAVAGQGGPAAADRQGPEADPASDLRLASASLRAASSCADLLAQYVDRGLAQVGPYGWDAGPIVMFDATGSATRSEASASAPTLPATTGSQSTASGTNVQEAGVDEPDVVKVVGGLLFRVQDDVLTTYDVAGAAPQERSSLTLDGLGDGELLVSGDRVVVLGTVDGAYDAQLTTRVVVLDASDPGAPQVVSTTDLDAELTAARLHDDRGDDVVRLVLRSYRPALDFVQPGPRQGERTALERNRQVVRDSTLADWLPGVDGEPVVDCADVAVPTDDDAVLGTTTVVGFRPGGFDPLASPTSTAVATDAATSYSSPDRVYLATAAPSGWWGSPTIDCIDRCLPPSPGGPGSTDGTTDLYAFALDGVATTFVAGGEVEGSVRDRWAMDFSDGTLRVAVGATSRTADASSVLTLREEGTELVEVGRVDGLGVGEEIKAVRWFDDLAIVVTFRQVDPLYAVDLTDPASPRLLGELKIPGYSEYLHPLGGRRLIGIGQDASPDGMVRGAQAALFDVTDLTSPARLDTVAYPRFSVAGAGTDPRQFTWLPDRRIALTVVSEAWRGRTGWVSVLRLGRDRMDDDMVPVEVGDEVAQVRLVPLADGRVVLVTGDGVSFFAL
ncbi:beta-propeller domain-containing protein [Nocardioides terrigena]|uniref:beta-propeller domain-containing protein n=1 Tax=Nocardioides terrigena TaxID=424797 RepID=UPI00131EF02E|nr:beta-propeller domain-containing protein [Nocardioides terrigena]